MLTVISQFYFQLLRIPEGLSDRSSGYHPGITINKGVHPGRGGGQNPPAHLRRAYLYNAIPGVLPPATVPKTLRVSFKATSGAIYS